MQKIILFLMLAELNCYSSIQAQPLDLHKYIQEELAKGSKKINIPKNTYIVDLKDEIPIVIENLKGVEIVGNGSDVILKNLTQMIQITNSEDITISGLRFDFDPLPFTEGKIVDMDKENKMWWDVEIFEGYPVDQIMLERTQIFDPKTLTLKKNLFTYFGGTFKGIEKVGDRRFKVTKSRKNATDIEEIGDLVVFSVGTRNTNANVYSIRTEKSKHVTFKDVILYSSTCFSFFEDESESNSYIKCKVIRKENDPKYSFLRLRSGNADSFHSKNAYIGPRIEGCEFKFHGDDCVAINSQFYRVINSNGNQVDISGDLRRLKIKKGHQVRFIDIDGNPREDATVLALDSIRTDPPADTTTSRRFRARNVVRLTLDKPVEKRQGDAVSSITMSGSGFIVKNNVMGYTRARGILIKASDGIISGNLVEGCELAGIVIAPEFGWMEAGFSRNIDIVGNTVRDCMFETNNPGRDQSAGITVIAINGRQKIAPEGAFRNINIRNNKVENCPNPGIIVTSVEKGTISGNTIVQSKQIIRSHGTNFGVDVTKPIWTTNTKYVLTEKNIIK